ncbi:MAG: hypothetical protein WD178_01200 [Actinomycetota bacterium]
MFSESSNIGVIRRSSPAAARRLACLCCVFFLLTGCVALRGGTPEGSSMFVSPDGRFQVLMPDDREETIERVGTDAGELETQAVTGRLGDSEVFGVFYTDIPERAGEIDSERSFEAAIANALAASPGLALAYRNQTFAYGGPAVDFTLEAPDRKVWARVAMVGRRTYLIQHTGPNTPQAAANYSRLIDTFEVLRKQA